MIKYHFTQNKYDCYGCRSCEQICPKNAIEMTFDEEGFLYPILKENICIDCGLCNKVCPIEIKKSNLVEAIKIAIAAQALDKNILNKSSSGGLFTLLATSILKSGGTVYGAAYTSNMYVTHLRVTSLEELEALRGSKYVQSDINNTYKQALSDLKKDIPVLFSGTPCQIHGLKLFLRKPKIRNYHPIHD
jgi:coenzyme F420-reducing hydrogenase beta subunit